MQQLFQFTLFAGLSWQTVDTADSSLYTLNTWKSSTYVFIHCTYKFHP